MKLSWNRFEQCRRLVRRILFIVLLAQLSCVFSGCSIVEIRRQSRQIGNASVIRGSVMRSAGQKGAIIVSLFRSVNNICVLENMMQTSAKGKYRFWVGPGTYYITAFLDSNNDGVYQQGEVWNYYGQPTAITVREDQTVTLDKMTISDRSPIMSPSVKVEYHLSYAAANLGKVVGLDDKSFTPDNYSMGMWRPLDFLQKVGGGLFCLQKYEHGKIPIIFVHGINGGPTDFSYVIEHLDRTRFQPWVIYYPSGLVLDIVSEHLVSGVVTMQNRYKFDKFVIVGHSMGGLVVRSFVKKYVEQHPERIASLMSVVTINSPLGGMPSAAYGAKAPIMVQSWRDVAPESEFLKGVNGWAWPPDIPYYLIFSYESGNDDGVVPLQQQLPLRQQQDAAHIYGFHDNHVGTLRDPSFLQVFSSILKHGSE